MSESRRERTLRAFSPIVIAVAMTTVAAGAMADNFGPVRYDPQGDQLIVTMMYDGTNPHHHFSIQWGRCHKLDQPGAPSHQIALQVLDDQGGDAATKSYTKTIKVPLAALSCRPARVTLWTSPALHGAGRLTLDIP